MATGEAAGAAATRACADHGGDVRNVDADALRADLADAGAIR